MDRHWLEVTEQAASERGSSERRSSGRGNDATVPSALHDESSLQRLVECAQRGDDHSCEQLLKQFRPLLRSQMHRAWSALQDELSNVEWDDVEAHVRFLFLARLRDFRLSQGVFFPHYIKQMLDVDCRNYVRQQRRQAAVPFSQVDLHSEMHDLDELADEYSPQSTKAASIRCESTDQLEDNLSLQTALETLTAPQREVIWRCCVLGHTESEAATQLNLSRSAVRNRLESALQRLRAFFHESSVGNPAHCDERITNLATRTGRTSTQGGARQREFWMGRINMAKDDKRPDLVGVGGGRPILLQGVFDFEATGLKSPQLLSAKLSYTVPPGHVLGIRYFRIGVSCERMVCLSTVVNGAPHRLVPVAANSSMHVPFAIVEPIIAGSQIEIHVAAEAPGTAIIDVGCLQMPA
ncbi:MAG TPA: sigma-70 family RNA polymerase sigma factor [Abditibacteriaceae bacterium]|jgi:RNA polymerase sigma factor (sigma-70 family)